MTTAVRTPAHPRALKRALLLGCALAGLGAMTGTAQAQAFNATETTAFGTVFYDRGTPGVETIRLLSGTAVIDWRPVANTIFLPAGHIATFTNGPNTPNFVVLNRIIATTPQRFDGTVLSQLRDDLGNVRTGGTVIFSSPGGLIIGSTGVFDVGSLVLTTLNVEVDAGGNFYDPATRGLVFDAGPSPITTSLITEAGARLNALQPNSYVALVGPLIRHGGATRVNGSAAYIAGERVQFRANQGLFDLIVEVGSGEAQPLIHTGSTGGPASGGVGDNHAIYLVAMPKNQAITAVLAGDIGFDPAVVVGVENGEIVLSAGANIVGGEVDRYGALTGVPAADLAANFDIQGGVVRSDLTGVARTNIRARPGGGTPTLTFQQDVSLYGGQSAQMSVTTGQSISVLGNAIVSAAAFDTITGAVDLTGGQARVFTESGGTIDFAGTLTVDASARGLVAAGGDAGSGTGGLAEVNADGGTINVAGALNILANGEGGGSPAVPVVNGGAGAGGTATLGSALGGAVNANDVVTMSANGTASASAAGATVDGAAGTGGTVSVQGFGAGNTVIAGLFTASANGTGGDVAGGTGLSGGQGTGGAINVLATDGNVDFNANASFVAAGQGGAGPVGGDGQGGNLAIEATRGTIDFLGAANGAADGFGGAGLLGGTGGNGQGGGILVAARSSDTSARITGGAFALSAAGQGGLAGNGAIGIAAGVGGNGTGGTIAIFAESANGTIMLGAVTAAADGLGGSGGAADNNTGGGTGGAGTGGEVNIGTIGGGAPGGGGPATGSATFASASLSARGSGGGGGFGAGAGGTGTGGAVGIAAEGAPARVTGATTLVASGQGSAGGGSPGGGVGAVGTAIGGTIAIGATAHSLTGAAGTVLLADVDGAANAIGAGPGNVAGEWHVGASGGGTVTMANVVLTALADGAGIGTPAASTLDPQGGTIIVTGTGRFRTDGDVLVNAGQAGRLAGNRYELIAGGDVVLSHAAPLANGFTVDVTGLYIQAAGDVTVTAGVVSRATDITDIRALGLATIAGRVVGREIRVGSIDIDVQADGQLGDAATETIVLDVDGGDNGPLDTAPPPGLGLGPNQFTVLGGTVQGPGYTLTNAEAGRIRAGTLRILVPALSGAAGRAPDLIVRDLTVNGGGAAAGLGVLQVITPGIGRVEGNVLMANARAADGLLLNARDRLEVVIPTASVRVRDGAGAPGGTLQLVSNNIWVASGTIIDALRADPNYAGRDEDLIDNDGVDAPRGYVEGNSVTLTVRGTAYVQNTTAARGTFLSGNDFGGITTGPGGLTIVADVANANVYAFGRRLNADGTVTTGDAFFYDSVYEATAGSNYTPVAAVNTCIIVTGLCPMRLPPDTGDDGPDPFTGPTDGSQAILPPATEQDDVIDSSFAADPLIEEPVTSGNETASRNCDPDQDGDCDDQPE